MESRPSTTVQLELADPLADKEVLALAAQAWPETERAHIWREIRLAAQADPTTVVLLAARRSERLLAAVVANILPGRAAVVWPPQFAGAETSQADISRVILRELAEALQARGVQVAQALLGAGDFAQAELLAAGRFWRAADLLFLSAEACSFPTEPPPLPFQLVPFQPADEARLIALIDRTYQGTLDCPQIDGTRATADVVCGHRAVGEFRPHLWQIVRQGDRDVGCVLVNVHSDVAHAELVYLGLVPEARGQCLGRLLTQQAQWLARQEKCERLVLAVDVANTPAIAAYRASGMTEWDRQTIWVLTLGGDASRSDSAT